MDFDIVQIEHSRMAPYLEAIPRKSRSKSVLMFHNFTSQQYGRVSHVEQRWDRKLRTWLHGVTMGYWEPRYAERFDRCITVSEADQDLLMKANPRLHVNVIPNGVDIEKYKPLPSPAENAPSLMFVGNMGYPPCVDAVVYFCQEIFPRIRQRIGAAELWIVGRDPRPEVLQLNGNGVHVTGRVDDVVPYYQKSTVCVVPLRAGGGTRLKILEAMALGRPVVSTTIGCEGLGVVDGEHLLVADTPEQFAEKTVNLLLEKKLYERIVVNGRKLVEVEYDWDKVAENLMQVYEKMVEG
jgi:glycosyltransferase involved in cell wall biosynthesis